MHRSTWRGSRDPVEALAVLAGAAASELTREHASALPRSPRSLSAAGRTSGCEEGEPHVEWLLRVCVAVGLVRLFGQHGLDAVSV